MASGQVNLSIGPKFEYFDRKEDLENSSSSSHNGKQTLFLLARKYQTGSDSIIITRGKEKPRAKSKLGMKFSKKTLPTTSEPPNQSLSGPRASLLSLEEIAHYVQQSKTYISCSNVFSPATETPCNATSRQLPTSSIRSYV